MLKFIEMPHEPDASIEMKHNDIALIGIGGRQRESAIGLSDGTSYRVFNISNNSVYEPCADPCEYIHGKSSFGNNGTKLGRHCCHRAVDGSLVIIINTVRVPFIIIKS